MPARPRSEVFEPDEIGVYHCWNRLVRRHLFGWDTLRGKNFSYRKDWVRDRLRQLAGAMAIDALDLPPILERLDIEPQAWFDSFLDFFRCSPNHQPFPAVVGSG